MKHTNQSPWNQRKLIGQKLPLKLKEIYSIRIRLEITDRVRDLALFNLAIDSKLRSCDLNASFQIWTSTGKNIPKAAGQIQRCKTNYKWEATNYAMKPVKVYQVHS